MGIFKMKGLAKASTMVLILLFLVGCGVFYHYQSKTPDFIVTFNDSKGVSPSAKVVLSGVAIGKVVSVKPRTTGVEMGIKIDSEHRSVITEASRFFLEPGDKNGRMLTKNIRANAKPLQLGTTVEGTDSALGWAAYDYTKGINELLGSDEIRESKDSINELMEEMDRQLERMDWEKLGEELEKAIGDFSRSIKESINADEMAKLRQELEQNLSEALEALERAQNSKEAQELKETIDKFRQRLEEEFQSQEPLDPSAPVERI